MEEKEFQERPVSHCMNLDAFPGSSSQRTLNGTFLVGFVMAKMGFQFYSGTNINVDINDAKLAVLVREPRNPDDQNALKVLRTDNHELGYLDRSVTTVISPLIDNEIISVGAKVLNSRTSSNEVPCLLVLSIFAKLDDFKKVKTAISQGGLGLVSQFGSRSAFSEARVVKEKSSEGGLGGVADIFRSVQGNAGRKGKLGSLEPPKKAIKSELFVHQKQGLWWLVNRENSDELLPFWEEKDGGYVNLLTSCHMSNRPEPLRGGIFADEMGLGKTLTLLSLIAFDKFDGDNIQNSAEEIGEEDKGVFVPCSKNGKRVRMSSNGTGGQSRRKIEQTLSDSNVKGRSVGMADKSVGVLGSKITLIVCPPVVISTWVTQIQEHTQCGSLELYVHYGPKRTKEVEKIKRHDIVLTTYRTLASDSRLLTNIEWWRVILDEGHMIKNEDTSYSRAATSLKAEKRWVVTGTPIQNGSFDLFSLMAFLRFEPFSNQRYWLSLIQKPLALGDEMGFSRLQGLIKTISLRRTKDMGFIELPSKTVETCYIELSGEQRELYDDMEREAKGIVAELVNSGRGMEKHSTVLCIILRLRQICNDLALCPLDPRFMPSSKIEDASNNPELLEKIVAMLQDGEAFDCPICLHPQTDPIITRCAHIFCRGCILKSLRHNNKCCPLCRHSLSASDLFSAPPESSNPENTRNSSRTTSSKVSTLVKLLRESRVENPTRNSVVFSQFKKMLVLLEAPLKEAGFKVLRLDSSKNATLSAQIIKEFGLPGPDGPTVLLASFMASGAGINLTAASKVYLFDPWWNSAVEEQAMDRVHRIGQKDNVSVVRLIVRNSIEEGILEMQKRKKKLANEAPLKQGTKARHKASIDNLRALLSL